MTGVRATYAALAALGILTAAPRAGADEARTSSLSWLRMPGAESCIATQALARTVEQRLGRTVFVSAAQADVSVEGRIEKRAAGGFRAVITIHDASGARLGTRELERPEASCEAMSEPLALVVAVMIDPEAATRPREPAAPEAAPAAPAPVAEPAAAPPPPPAPEPARDAPAGPPPPRPRPAPWRFEGDAYGTVSYGLAPSLAGGAGVEAILYPPAIPVGFRGYTSLFLPTTAEVRGLGGQARASFDMLFVGGSLCPTIEGRRVNVMGCAGGQIGLLRPRAETAAGAIGEDLMPLLNAVLEARISVKIAAPIGATAGVGGALPLLRPKARYTATDGGRAILHEPSVLALTADVGLGFFFP